MKQGWQANVEDELDFLVQSVKSPTRLRADV